MRGLSAWGGSVRSKEREWIRGIRAAPFSFRTRQRCTLSSLQTAMVPWDGVHNPQLPTGRRSSNSAGRPGPLAAPQGGGHLAVTSERKRAGGGAVFPPGKGCHVNEDMSMFINLGVGE